MDHHFEDYELIKVEKNWRKTDERDFGDEKKIRKKPSGNKKKIAYGFILGILAILFLGSALMIRPYKKYVRKAKEIMATSSPADFKEYRTSHIYDKENKLIATLSSGKGRGVYLEYGKIPEPVMNAFIAIEDRSYWKNRGYDKKALVRAVWEYISSRGKGKTGASTITQQLVRMKYLTKDKTIDRKMTEIFCAREMTQIYSKEQILEYYINNCYFANGIYGIEAASEYYFSKEAKELSLAETAYLCAIPNRPSYYNPIETPDHVNHRKEKILDAMEECGYISKKEKDSAKRDSTELRVKETEEGNDAQTTYAVHCATQVVMKENGFEHLYEFGSREAYNEYQKKYEEAFHQAREEIYKGGYEIYTSLDTKIQNDAQKSLDDIMTDNELTEDGTYAFQAASVVLDNETGKVLAVIGGRSQKEKELSYNRAYQTYRQPGSAIKPILVYTPALMSGYTQNYEIENIDVKAADQQADTDNVPKAGQNYKMSDAVKHSINGCAYRMLDQIGLDYGISFLTAMDFRRIVPEDKTLSIALGGFTEGVSPVEMASAYGAIANGGIYRHPTCITSMYLDGTEIYEEEKETEVYTPLASERMIQIMKGVLEDGTAKKIHWAEKTEAAGKTGTTNDNKDGWFCGMTPYYTIAVWAGHDTPRSVEDLKGSTYPAKIWKRTMKKLIKGKEDKSFSTLHIQQIEKANANEKYLPGMDGDEFYEEGYRVSDYRNDHAHEESIDVILHQIASAVNMEYLEQYKKVGDETIALVKKEEMKQALTEKVNTIYKEREDHFKAETEQTENPTQAEATTQAPATTEEKPSTQATTKEKPETNHSDYEEDKDNDVTYLY